MVIDLSHKQNKEVVERLIKVRSHLSIQLGFTPTWTQVIAYLVLMFENAEK